jgi:hypothetical protein
MMWLCSVLCKLTAAFSAFSAFSAAAAAAVAAAELVLPMLLLLLDIPANDAQRSTPTTTTAFMMPSLLLGATYCATRPRLQMARNHNTDVSATQRRKTMQYSLFQSQSNRRGIVACVDWLTCPLLLCQTHVLTAQ